jgi:hypothetical protein
MPHCKKTVQTDKLRQEKPTAHFSTFGFARHTSRPFAKPKELKFSHGTDRPLTILQTLYILKNEILKNLKLS